MNTIEWIAAGLFSVALLHTFSTKFFVRMANRRPDHAGVWHLLAEVEVVFGLWAMVLVVVMAMLLGTHAAAGYLDSRDFTEPMFVFAIMVVAGSRAILQLARSTVNQIASIVPLSGGMCFQFVALSFVPLLGSLITEPAAMTLAAMMLRDRVYGAKVSDSLEIRDAWRAVRQCLDRRNADVVRRAAGADGGLDLGLGQLAHAVEFRLARRLAVVVNALVTTTHLPQGARPAAALRGPGRAAAADLDDRAPCRLSGRRRRFLHHPPVFMGVLLFFLGIATAYPQFQSRLILREGLLVAFFLAGLVVLGGQQRWWLEPLLRAWMRRRSSSARLR